MEKMEGGTSLEIVSQAHWGNSINTYDVNVKYMLGSKEWLKQVV